MKRLTVAAVRLAAVVGIGAMALACEDDELNQVQTPTDPMETPSEAGEPETESMAVSVTHEAFLSAAALRSSELPEGYVFPSLEYDESRRIYRIEWDPDDAPLVSSQMSYHESSSAAESYSQRLVDNARKAGYQVEAAPELHGWVATSAGEEGAFLVAVNFAVGRVAGVVAVADTAEVEDIQTRSEALAAAVVDRIDDLPLPGEEVTILRSDLELRKIAFGAANKGDVLLRELQKRADGEEDAVTDAYIELLVDCEILRTAEFFQLWVLIAPSCTHYLEVYDLLSHGGSVGRAIEEVVAANALLDERLGWLTAGSPPVAVSPTTQAASPAGQGLASDPDHTRFDVLVTAGLWSSAFDLILELDDLISRDGDGSQRAAIWYSLELSFHCYWAEEDFPTLWNRVGGACNEAESVGPAALVGLVDSERYEQALDLTEAVEDAAIEHLLQLADIEKPTYELMTTASLTAHAVSLAGELENLMSPEGGSTPLAATLLSMDLAVDCGIAEDESPELWAKVTDACRAAESTEILDLVDSGRYEQALGLVQPIRDGAASHLWELCRPKD